MIMMKGYEQKKYPVATKRYVQWLELESDEEAIREYRRLHSEGVLVVEINAGQMVEDVRLAINGEEKVEHFGRLGGIVPEPEEIVNALKEKL